MTRTRVAPAASRRFCAAMLECNHRRKTKSNRLYDLLSAGQSLSRLAHKNAGWQPALRSDITPCA